MSDKEEGVGVPRSRACRPIVLKVLLLGDGGVGKSCLMNRFVRNQFDCHLTVGVEFLKKDVTVGGKTYTLQIWDTAGQERYRSLRTPFYRGTDLCVLSYALDDRDSFEALDVWLEEFRLHADVRDARRFPFLLVGNKADVAPEKRRVTPQDVEEWCASRGGVPSVETSAKDASNVESAFHMAVENWIKFDAAATAEAMAPSAGGAPAKAEYTVKLKGPPQTLRCCVYTKTVKTNVLG